MQSLFLAMAPDKRERGCPLAFVHEHLSIQKQCLLKKKTKEDYSNKHNSKLVSDPIQLRKQMTLFSETCSNNSCQLMWHLLILSFRFFLFLVLVSGVSTVRLQSSCHIL